MNASPSTVARELPLAARDALVELLMLDLREPPRARAERVARAIALLDGVASVASSGAAIDPEHEAEVTTALEHAGLASRTPGTPDGADGVVVRTADWSSIARERLARYAAALASAPRGDALTERLLQARHLFALRLYFEVHEVLEPPWQDATGETARILQGLIQAAVAWHHGERGNVTGARRLAADASVKLADAPVRWNGFPLGVVSESLAGYARWLEDGALDPIPGPPVGVED